MPNHLHTQLDVRIQIDLVTVSLNNNWLLAVIMHTSLKTFSNQKGYYFMVIEPKKHGYMESSLYHAT